MTEWMTIVLLCGWLSLLSRKSIRGRINSSWRGWWGWRGWWCRSYPAGWCGWRWRFVLHLKLLQALFRSLGLVRSRKPGKYMGNKKIIIYIYIYVICYNNIYIYYIANLILQKHFWLGAARISPYSNFSFSFWSFRKDNPRCKLSEDHCREARGWNGAFSPMTLKSKKPSVSPMSPIQTYMNSL